MTTLKRRLTHYLYDTINDCKMHTMFSTERVDGNEVLVNDLNVKKAIHLYEKKHNVTVSVKREIVINDYWNCYFDFLYEIPNN